jgi:UDP:flavonoid glycosyltransferase YjiC (YdhE family)
MAHASSRHIILSSIGTDGDIFPYVGLGARLRARGQRVTLVASAHYEPLAIAHGFAFQALVSAAENHELFGHPDFWNPLKTAALSARWGVRFLQRQYDLFSKLITEDTVLVANPGVFAATLAHEKTGAPLATLVLQPGIIPSSIAPPIMPGFVFLRRAPRPIWRAFWRALDLVGHFLVGRDLNRLRAALGLKPIRRIFHNWLSPQLVLGLFPEWYGPPQTDWPPQMRLTGFPLFDGGQTGELPAGLLEFCRAGKPPVAFTFGTGMAHPGELFRAALDACTILGARGIFLTKYRDQLSDPLPPSIHHCAFAPFQSLLPVCAAVVHHGGIGTVAQALAAGIPQLIRPLCFDQTDNGARTQRLGAGDWVKPGRHDGRRIADALARLMTPETYSGCRAVAAKFQVGDALETAADFIETFAATSAATPAGSV